MNNKNITVKIISVVTSGILVFSPMAMVSADTASVAIQNNTYNPRNITVQQGTLVTWKNWDNMPHTVTSDNNAFNSGTLNYGDTFAVQFNSIGTFNYFCQFHGSPGGVGMSGMVTVVSSTTPPGNSLRGTVDGSQPGGGIIVNSITPTKTNGTSDGTFQNGWSWVFDISAPANETNLMMKFDNWLMEGGGFTMPVSNNMRFYSSQSSNSFNQNSATYITAPGAYSNAMFLTGDLDPGPMRRVQITVETRIPTGTQSGSYTTNFGIKTQ